MSFLHFLSQGNITLTLSIYSSMKHFKLISDNKIDDGLYKSPTDNARQVTFYQ